LPRHPRSIADGTDGGSDTSGGRRDRLRRSQAAAHRHLGRGPESTAALIWGKRSSAMENTAYNPRVTTCGQNATYDFGLVDRRLHGAALWSFGGEARTSPRRSTYRERFYFYGPIRQISGPFLLFHFSNHQQIFSGSLMFLESWHKRKRRSRSLPPRSLGLNMTNPWSGPLASRPAAVRLSRPSSGAPPCVGTSRSVQRWRV
jgi:hypothetical protein